MTRGEVDVLVRAVPTREASGCQGVPERSAGSSHQITQTLLACRLGDDDAFRQLMTLTYRDLRRIAHRQLQRGRPGLTLNTTGLIHEAYLKLVNHAQMDWRDRSHFFAVSARAMRQIIVDYAKSRSTHKRGGNAPHVDLDEVQIAASGEAEMLVALDEALQRLASLDERMIRVVECRFFAGFSEQETAEALAVSLRTVQRDWMRARAWLREEMGCRSA